MPEPATCAGQVYPQTTNPHVTTGDGIAMAYRAKAAMADLEFIQVRPASQRVVVKSPVNSAFPGINWRIRLKLYVLKALVLSTRPETQPCHQVPFCMIPAALMSCCPGSQSAPLTYKKQV